MGASESPSHYSFAHGVNDSCRGTRTWEPAACVTSPTHAGLVGGGDQEGQARDKKYGSYGGGENTHAGLCVYLLLDAMLNPCK